MTEKMTVDQARYRMVDQDFDCAQTVLSHYADSFDLDEETALKISSAFGGGIAGRGDVCGCVTGALMVLGLKYGFSEENDKVGRNIMKSKNNEFLSKFEEKFGSIYCRGLLGLDVSKPDEAAEISQKGIMPQRCPGFAAGACEILDEMLSD